MSACSAASPACDALPRLAALGVTAIELMPIAEFPGTRNWGYDGVLPFAPDCRYGTPNELKALIDAAHGLGLMVFLDVVYNHFGPDGNYLRAVRQSFFRERHNAVGRGDRFRAPAKCANSSSRTRSTGSTNTVSTALRFDAAHATSTTRSFSTSSRARSRVGSTRPSRALVLENEDNDARLLHARLRSRNGTTTAHHVLHVLLTGESDGYYADYADATAEMLARCLARRLRVSGRAVAVPRRRAARRAERPSAADRVRRRSCRTTIRSATARSASGLSSLRARSARVPPRAAAALAADPAAVHGRGLGQHGDRFLYFTDYEDELATAVREGRRREFARFTQFSAEDLPDPNARSTFEASRPDFDARDNPFRARIRELIALRRAKIIPRLAHTRSLGARVVAPAAVDASWRMGDGSVLRIVANFSDASVAIARGDGEPFFATSASPGANKVAPFSCSAWLAGAST